MTLAVTGKIQCKLFHKRSSFFYLFRDPNVAIVSQPVLHDSGRRSGETLEVFETDSEPDIALLVFLSAEGFPHGPIRDTSLRWFEARKPFVLRSSCLVFLEVRKVRSGF